MTYSPTLIVVAILGIIAILGIVSFCPFVGLFLFLSIGLIKVFLVDRMPFLIGYTYDVAMIITAFWGIFIYRLRHGQKLKWDLPLPFILCWLFLVALIWLRYPDTRAPEYGFKKAVIFSVYNTLTVFLAPMFINSLSEAKKVLKVICFVAFSGLLGLLILGNPMDSWRGARMTFLGADPHVQANFYGMAILVFLGFWLVQKKTWRLLLLIIGVSLFLYGIFITGARGIAFFLLPCVILLFWLFRSSVNFTAIIMGLFTVLIVGLVLEHTLMPETLERFQGDILSKGISDRLWLYKTTFQGFITHPLFGTGTGDSAFQISNLDMQAYPHNYILEVANELGIIGLVPYLILLGYGLKSGWDVMKIKFNPELLAVRGTIFGCFLLAFLDGMKSGTFIGGYRMYFFLTLTTALGRIFRIDDAPYASDLGDTLEG